MAKAACHAMVQRYARLRVKHPVPVAGLIDRALSAERPLTGATQGRVASKAQPPDSGGALPA